MFRVPNTRPRSWRICFNKRFKTWTCDYSLQQLADVLLLPINAPSDLDYSCFFVEKVGDEGLKYEEDLTKPFGSKFQVCCCLRCQAGHLEAYRHDLGSRGKDLFDLSQNPSKRQRVELKDRTREFITIANRMFLGNALASQQAHSFGP